MSTTVQGLVVPDYDDPPDGPADFRAFAQSISAATILGPTGSVVKAPDDIGGTVVSDPTWTLWAAAALPQPTTLTQSSLLFVRVMIDVTPGAGGFAARIGGMPGSATAVFSGGRAFCVATAIATEPAGPLTMSLEVESPSAPSTVNALTWNIFATGGIT